MNRSISFRFIAVLLLVLALGQSLGAFLYLRESRNTLTTSLHDRMQRSLRQAAGVLAEPLLNYNFDLIEAYLTESLQDLDLQTMRVLDAQQRVVRERTVERREAQTFHLAEPMMIGGQTAGTVEIVYTPKTINDHMRKNLLLIPLFQAGMLLVVALVLIALFTAHVKKPVLQLNRSLDRITSGDLATTIAVGRRDEIGLIAGGVNFLVERLAGTIQRMNSISANLNRTMLTLNQTFDKVRLRVDRQHQSTEEVSRAVEDASGMQLQIIANTENLLAMAGDNASALLEMSASSDEIAGNADNLNRNLQDAHSTLAELTQSAREVASMANDVSAAVMDASSSIEEIYGSVRHVEEVIRETTSRNRQTTELISEKGIAAVSEARERMRHIGSAIESLTSAIGKLGNRSKDIGSILSVIEDVTEQTRLLSLNALIIAAQAGEQGRGFAVVANEMKTLSDQTDNSTREIEAIVSAIQQEITQVVSETRATAEMIRGGDAVVARTAEVLQEILSDSQHTTQMAQSIDRAAQEQTNGLKLMVGATEQIKDKIQAVNRATREQEKSTAFLLGTLTPIREMMEATRSALEEQAKSTRMISGNIELANQRNAEIATASGKQRQLNDQVLAALREVMRLGDETEKEVNTLTPLLDSLLEEMDALAREMGGFSTGS